MIINAKYLSAIIMLVVLAIAAGFFIGHDPRETDSVYDFSEPELKPTGQPYKEKVSQGNLYNENNVSIEAETDIPYEAEANINNFEADAIDSMRYGREEIDPRAPLLTPSYERVLPTEQELKDFDAYEDYEQRETRKTYRAYVIAAEEKAQYLKEMIKKAEEDGLPEEQVQEGIEKLRLIEAMRAELLQQHPDLLNSDEAPLH